MLVLREVVAEKSGGKFRKRCDFDARWRPEISVKYCAICQGGSTSAEVNFWFEFRGVEERRKREKEESNFFRPFDLDQVVLTMC